MILFAADRHYDQHCGRHIYEQLPCNDQIEFYEDDWSCFAAPFVDDCELLMLNMIADTCDVPPPGPKCEAHVRAYVESGKPLLLLHGASAAFWHWDWWREIVGYRWVRHNDPDDKEPSWHPRRAYRVELVRSRHPLTSFLQPMDVPEDEIYLGLEQTCPCWTLLQANTVEGTFPMCYECSSPSGSRIIGFLPGHDPRVTTDPVVIKNIQILIDDLLGAE